MSHEGPLLELQEEFENASSSDLATDDDLAHVSQRRQQDMTDREVQNEDLDSDDKEKCNVNKYLINQNAAQWAL